MIWGLVLIFTSFVRSSRHLKSSFSKNHPKSGLTWPKNTFSHCQRPCLNGHNFVKNWNCANPWIFVASCTLNKPILKYGAKNRKSWNPVERNRPIKKKKNLPNFPKTKFFFFDPYWNFVKIKELKSVFWSEVWNKSRLFNSFRKTPRAPKTHNRRCLRLAPNFNML